MTNDLHFAVVVGINVYPGFVGENLSHARTDADRFADWLRSKTGGDLPRVNVKHITATPAEEGTFAHAREARPKRAEVDAALSEITDMARDRVSENHDDWNKTRLYVYVSGHGIAPPGGEAALLFADADDDRLGFNLELSLYSQWYEACGWFREVLIFADCCRERRGGAPQAIGPYGFNPCDEPYGQTIAIRGYATKLGGAALEPRDVGDVNAARGFFTSALLDGLDGFARDPDQNNAVSLRRLTTYLKDTVRELTKEQATPQEVQVKGDYDVVMLFGPPARPQRTRKVTIRLPAGFTGKAELRAGKPKPGDTSRPVLHSWDAGDSPPAIDLPEAIYEVTPAGGAANTFAGDGLFTLIGKDKEVQL